jgi:NAD(P)-dependent dehydrogenase (short-subunit alcohol dehydrogenase family)
MPAHGSQSFALVTGSSRGIGRGVALKLAEAGVQVAVHYYQNEASAADTLAQVKACGSNGILVQADLTCPEQVRGLFQTIEDQFGALDIFVSNARPELSTFYRPPLEVSEAQWDTAMDSQAKAFLLGVQAAAKLMHMGGRIVAVTYAPSARTGSWQPWIAMGAGKAALEALVRYFAVALARQGITVNAVSPGLTEDSVLNGLPLEIQQAAQAWHESGWTPMGRLGKPADVGDVVALMCSRQAAWITGQTIYADGGASLMDVVFPLEIQHG